MSVMMTWVAWPVGRGSVLNGKSIVSALLRLMLARYSDIGFCIAAGIGERSEIVAAGQQRLRVGRRRAGRIGAHALEHLHELGGVVRRLHDALQGVATDAIGQRRLDFVVARQAAEPFAVGELIGERVGLAQLNVGRRRSARRHVNRFGSVELIAYGADRNRVMPRREFSAGKW